MVYGRCLVVLERAEAQFYGCIVYLHFCMVGFLLDADGAVGVLCRT